MYNISIGVREMGNKIAAIVIDTNNRRSVVIRDVEKKFA